MIPGIRELQTLGEFYEEPSSRMPDVWDELSIRRYWYDQWMDAVSDDYDVSILVDGKSGIGKSALAVTIGMQLDRTFTHKTVLDHIAFTAEEFLACIEKAKKGQVVIYDEAVRGMLSTDTFAAEQKALVTAFAIIRAKNLIMILLAPEIWQVAKSFRARRAQWWIHVEDRGIAWVHVRDDSVRYEQDSKLHIYKDVVHGPLTWDDLKGTRIWAAYYKLKMDRVNSYLHDAQADLSKHKPKGKKSDEGSDDSET